MHIKSLSKYYFINTIDTNNLQKQDRETIIIYRNYSSSNININKLLILKNFLRKKGNKLFLANNFKLALKLKLDGVYLPSFNKDFRHNNYFLKKEFIVLGSAHNLKEIKIKEKQGVKAIFISSVFRKKGTYLGINKFNNLKKHTCKNVIALGGINKTNIKKLKLLNIYGFAGIELFSKKNGPLNY